MDWRYNTKWYQVDYYKECYPFKDKCGCFKVKTLEEARKIKDQYSKQGFDVWIHLECAEE